MLTKQMLVAMLTIDQLITFSVCLTLQPLQVLHTMPWCLRCEGIRLHERRHYQLPKLSWSRMLTRRQQPPLTIARWHIGTAVQPLVLLYCSVNLTRCTVYSCTAS